MQLSLEPSVRQAMDRLSSAPPPALPSAANGIGFRGGAAIAEALKLNSTLWDMDLSGMPVAWELSKYRVRTEKWKLRPMGRGCIRRGYKHFCGVLFFGLMCWPPQKKTTQKHQNFENFWSQSEPLASDSVYYLGRVVDKAALG